MKIAVSLQNRFKTLFLFFPGVLIFREVKMRICSAKSAILLLMLLLPVAQVQGQIKGESYLKWYSWNATGGFMMPLNLFRVHLANGVDHTYRFSGTPGYVFTLGKPVGLQLIVGAELEDQRTKGAMKGFLGQAADTFYNIRTRTYSLFLQYYFIPNTDINPFVMGKIGYGGINRAFLNRDLSRTIPADRWDFMFSMASGVTVHPTPNISFNLYGEVSTIPVKYLPKLFRVLPKQEKKIFPTARIVLTVTGHTDIRVFYPFKRGKTSKTKYKPHEYLPFSRVRVR
jgi:opacity protein-like surface antigen